MVNKNKPGLSQEPIGRLIEYTVNGTYDIPEFQREFVWTKNQVADLLDSLIKGYPIGSILLWDLSDYVEGKHIYENKAKQWVVDGQQRLVALSLLKLKKPYWLDTDKWNELVKKYKIKINILSLDVALEYPAIKYDPEWIYPYEVFNANENEMEQLAEDIANKLNKPRLFTKIYSNLKKIQDALGIDVPVIKVNTSLENIATIFKRINSAGTRIKQADITLAYVAAYNKGWIRDRFIKYIDDLEEEGFYFDPTLLIRAITAIGDDKAILKDVSEDLLRNVEGKLDTAFMQFKYSLNFLIQSFREIGILSSKMIYAKNTIIPLIYLYNRFKNDFDFKKAFFFFLLALWRGRYSGASETTLQEDINTIKKASEFEEALISLIKKLELADIKIEKDVVKNAIHYQGEGRFFKLLLYLVAYQEKAVDWFTKVRLGYTKHNEINRDFSIEEHHFFPRSLLKSVGFDKDKRELLANITFVNPGTNKRLRYEPYVYIRKYNIDENDLRKQLIPIDEELWKIGKYEEFIDESAKIISGRINNFMMSLYPEILEYKEF